MELEPAEISVSRDEESFHLPHPPAARTCAACGTELRGEYCHDCGQQRADRTHLRVAYIAGEAFRELTSFDGKIWSTLHLLYLRPGQLVVDYLEGRGSLHVSPVKLFLLSLTLYFFIAPFRLLHPDRIREVAATIPAGEASAFLVRLQQNMESGGFFDRYQFIYTALLALTVFLSALLLKLIWRKRYFGEHLVFGLHDLSFVFMLIIPVSVFPVIGGQYLTSLWLSAVMIVIYTLWMTLALRRVYQVRWIALLPIAALYLVMREVVDGIIGLAAVVLSVQ